MQNALILVCDDAGFASVDRGIRMLIDETGVPVCADYLIERDGAAERARMMSEHPLASIGLHFELSEISDADRVALTHALLAEGSVLGEREDIRSIAAKDARRQLALFRETLGRDPSHISTHGNFNTDVHDAVLPWWNELMDALFDGNVPPMQLAVPYIRHNLYGWNLPDRKHEPLTPEQFGQKLRAHAGCGYIEFVTHPALPEESDASLDMLFTAGMRVADVEAAIAIIRSGAVERAGFRIVPVESVASGR